jgi:hypothetical protein
LGEHGGQPATGKIQGKSQKAKVKRKEKNICEITAKISQ